jgi:hypothetical protein
VEKTFHDDTVVFDALWCDIQAGDNVWTGRTGTREAIQRDGYSIDPMSSSPSLTPLRWLFSTIKGATIQGAIV